MPTHRPRPLAVIGLFLPVLAACLPFDGVGHESVGQRVVAAEGAYVCTSDEGAHIAIPAGALAEDTVITITEVPLPEEALEQGAVGPAYDFGPDGTHFLTPVWIQLHVRDLPAGRSIEELSLYNQSGGVVEELSDVYVDAEAGSISGTTTHFSIFYAAFSGPAGGRGVRIGGPGLTPLFGASSTSTPPEVQLWFADDGTVSSDPYSGPRSEVLVIQVDTGTPGAGRAIYVEGWTISPVDPGGTVGPTGDRISTSGFWNDFFANEIEAPLRDLRTDADGRLTFAVRADHLLGHMVRAPAGYSEGRLRLRLLDADAVASVDVNLAFARSLY